MTEIHAPAPATIPLPTLAGEGQIDRVNTGTAGGTPAEVPLITGAQKAGQSDRMRGLYDGMVDHLRKAGVDGGALKAGERFPPFLLPEADGQLLGDAELLAGGPAVIAFVRGLWCPYCRTALTALAAAQAEIRAHGARLVVVTPEAGGRHRQLKQRMGLDCAVLSDVDSGLALACGLVFALPEAVRDVYRVGGINLPSFYDNRSWMLPIPATFVLDRTGIVRYGHVDADFRNRPDPAVFTSALAALSAT
jgi:peroxiredoxin